MVAGRATTADSSDRVNNRGKREAEEVKIMKNESPERYSKKLYNIDL